MSNNVIIPPPIKPNPLGPYRIMYNLPPDTWLVINMGGRGGGKSYETAKFAAIMAVQKQKRIAVLRDQQSTIEQSILNEIKLRYEEINEKSGGFYDQHFEFQQRGLKDKARNMDLIFTKGFQTSQKSQKAALKSLSDVDIAIIEEAEDIRDEQKFNTFADSIRKEGSVIIVNLNTPDKNHWLIKRYFTLEEPVIEGFTDKEVQGYFKAVPKAMAGVIFTFTTFEDNPHLPEKIINKYKSYGQKESEYYDVDYYLAAICGLVSEGKKGRIFRKWQSISYDEFKALPYASFAGLDFGYSEDPNAILEVKAHNKKAWIRKICYETELSNEATAKIIQQNLPKSCPVYCDSQEPKSIDELRKFRVNAFPAIKGPDSILAGIKKVKEYTIFYVPDKDLENEYTEYSWAFNANQEQTDVPEDKNNHLMDALRYAIYTRSQIKKLKTA